MIFTPLSSTNKKVERQSYAPFVKATNHALLQLCKLNALGLAASKEEDDANHILFHHNDKPIYQTHQGEKSERKPDVVVVPWHSARKVREVNDNGQKFAMYTGENMGCQKPDGNFQWMDVLSTVEFKRTKQCLPGPPDTYAATDYAPPDKEYLEMNNLDEPTGSTPVLATGPPQTSHKTSNERKPPSVPSCCFLTDMCDAATLSSAGTKNLGDKKRPSDHLPSNEPSSKRPRSNQPRGDEKEKEPKKIHPNVQNGLYVAEIFAAHVARQHVFSLVVNSKSTDCCRPLVKLITRTRRRHLCVVF